MSPATRSAAEPAQRPARSRLAWLLAASLSLAGCYYPCTSGVLEPWDPGPDEYRLLLSNGTGATLLIYVDDRLVGRFCAGLTRATVGTFRRDACSTISAVEAGSGRLTRLDDCFPGYASPCSTNNQHGRTCFDTREFSEVEGEVE